jgi:hypothetical protein
MSASATIYLPVYKVKVDYIVRQGRGWSPFEHMVLWRLTQGRATSLELAQLASVPLRLVVECLIELMGANWVDVHTGGDKVSFEATAAGHKAAQLKQLVEYARRLKRRTTLCMDRLTMGFFEPEDLTLIHQEKLPKNAFLLKPRVFKLAMTPAGSLDRLYMLEDETFEEWVDYRVTSQRFFAALTLVGGKVEGLPSYAPPVLHEAVLEDVADCQQYEPSIAVEAVRIPPQLETEDGYCFADVQPEDIVIGGREHFALIRQVLENAKSYVLVHTCFVHPDAVLRLMPLIEAAAKRGVDVDLLWGQRSETLQDWSRTALADVKTIFETLPPSLRSRVRFGDHDTGSHAKVILADSGPRKSPEAYVGSCNWLSSRFERIEMSIRVREPWAIGTVATGSCNPAHAVLGQMDP